MTSHREQYFDGLGDIVYFNVLQVDQNSFSFGLSTKVERLVAKTQKIVSPAFISNGIQPNIVFKCQPVQTREVHTFCVGCLSHPTTFSMLHLATCTPPERSTHSPDFKLDSDKLKMPALGILVVRTRVCLLRAYSLGLG